MLKRTLHTFFGEEFFYRSHKLINFLEFILANFWKRENFFLKMMNTVKMYLWAAFHSGHISQQGRERTRQRPHWLAEPSGPKELDSKLQQELGTQGLCQTPPPRSSLLRAQIIPDPDQLSLLRSDEDSYETGSLG